MSAYDRVATALVSMLILAALMLDEPAGSECPGLIEPELAESMPSVGDTSAAIVMVMDAGISAGMKDIQLAVQESW